MAAPDVNQDPNNLIEQDNQINASGEEVVQQN